MNPSPLVLMRGLGYSFQDPALFELAQTHSSVSRNRNNERLEFVGAYIRGMFIDE